MTHSIVSSSDAWNSALTSVGGHLLQSWEWGEFKTRHGWDVERVCVEGPNGFGMAQMLFKRKGPISVAYVPRGPAMRPVGDPRSLFVELRAKMDAACRRRLALSLVLEHDAPLGMTGSVRTLGFVRGPDHIQPGRTVKVPLQGDDAILAQMHQKNRYSIRLAGRRGVTVERGDATAASVDAFYGLMRETADRNHFGIHTRAYYADFLRVFGDRTLMLFAIVDGNIAAGLIAARFGPEASYMYGGSSTTHRADGAAFILQYDAMRWARDAGSDRYDLWGIPHQREVPTVDMDATGATASVGEDMRGLLNFKTRFGGEIVDYPPMMERRYIPLVSWLAGRVAFDRT